MVRSFPSILPFADTALVCQPILTSFPLQVSGSRGTRGRRPGSRLLGRSFPFLPSTRP